MFTRNLDRDRSCAVPQRRVGKIAHRPEAGKEQKQDQDVADDDRFFATDAVRPFADHHVKGHGNETGGEYDDLDGKIIDAHRPAQERHAGEEGRVPDCGEASSNAE